MTDLEKAARMALEALEQLQGGCTDSNDGTMEAITVWCPEVIAALRQALDQPKQRWAVFCARCRKEWSVPYEHPGKSVCKECATHLLQALEQPAQQEAKQCAQCKKEYRCEKTGVGCPKCAPGLSVSEAEFREPIQPAQQEPVAWRNAALRVGEDLCSVGPFGYYDMTAEQWLDWALSVVTVHAPPTSKPWVGLTDEEIARVVSLAGFAPDWAEANIATQIVRVCQNMLKEKNNGTR